MSKYQNFVKKWSNERNITSFFGSDKRKFLEDWERIKNANITSKDEIDDEGKQKKTGYKLYSIKYKGSKGQSLENFYNVENKKIGLENKNRKVYDAGNGSGGYLYKFWPIDANEKIDLTHLKPGSLLGTLEQIPELFEKVVNE